MRSYIVTIEGLRPGNEGKRYQRVFEAETKDQALDQAVETLMRVDGWFWGAEYHVVAVK
jgi:hypothetical protein